MLRAASPTIPSAVRLAATPAEANSLATVVVAAADTALPARLFAIVCSNCGADATVPFRPRGDRPVYCSDCFSQMRNS